MGEIITQVRVLMLIFVLGVIAALTEVTTSKPKEEGETTQPVRGDMLVQQQPLWWNNFSAFFPSRQEAEELRRGIEHRDVVITGCCKSTPSMRATACSRNINGDAVIIVQNINVNGENLKQLFYTETCNPVPDCRCNCSCMLEDIVSQAIVYTSPAKRKVRRDYVWAGKICRCVNRDNSTCPTSVPVFICLLKSKCISKPDKCYTSNMMLIFGTVCGDH